MKISQLRETTMMLKRNAIVKNALEIYNPLAIKIEEHIRDRELLSLSSVLVITVADHSNKKSPYPRVLVLLLHRWHVFHLPSQRCLQRSKLYNLGLTMPSPTTNQQITRIAESFL